jgi:hypothetical protein
MAVSICVGHRNAWVWTILTGSLGVLQESASSLPVSITLILRLLSLIIHGGQCNLRVLA